ncbi:MAG: nucleoside monophosphate kinase [Actinomycetota bacterium]|nr:nucleoside monophosphate kinase [Actinomycetota bacterium]
MEPPHALRRIVMLGPPASGKGTQGILLAAALQVPHVSAGQLLRRSVAEGDPYGLAELLSHGRLVPDDLVETLVVPALHGGFVLDGFPRTATQARWLDEVLEARGWPVEAVVEITVDPGTLAARMVLRSQFEKRADDRPEVFLHRLEEYQREAPMLRAHYGRQLITVDGEGSEDEVFQRVLRAVQARTPAQAGRSTSRPDFDVESVAPST